MTDGPLTAAPFRVAVVRGSTLSRGAAWLAACLPSASNASRDKVVRQRVERTLRDLANESVSLSALECTLSSQSRGYSTGSAPRMARRKSKWIDDGSSSDGDSDDVNDDSHYDPHDPDVAAERELFRNPYGRGKKRTRQQLQDDATYGVFAAAPPSDDSAPPPQSRSRGTRKPDYLKCVPCSRNRSCFRG